MVRSGREPGQLASPVASRLHLSGGEDESQSWVAHLAFIRVPGTFKHSWEQGGVWGGEPLPQRVSRCEPGPALLQGKPAVGRPSPASQLQPSSSAAGQGRGRWGQQTGDNMEMLAPPPPALEKEL